MDTRSDIAGLTADELAANAAEVLPRGAGRARELYRLTMRSGRFDPQAVEMGPAARAAWHERFRFALPSVDRVVGEPCPEAPGENTTKAVLRAADGRCFESVHLPMGRGRHTLCVSTQVGCRMGCAFCQTARMGLRRQLSAAEIVGQVLVARHVLNWPIRNVVFMGMGEPLDNWGQLRQALLVLTERNGLAFAQDRLTVCTVGQAAGIRQLATLGWKRLGLSISLNAADDVLRARLMPATRGTPLTQLQRELVAYRPRTNFAFGINYCLLPGINDEPGVEHAIAAFCAPLGRCLVNVIPYNPGAAPLTHAPDENETIAFTERLRAAGCAVRRRVTKGRSVMAGCGQLGAEAAGDGQ